MAESQWGWRGDGLMVGWGWLSGGILFVLARSDSDGFLEERIGGNVKIRKKNRNRWLSENRPYGLEFAGDRKLELPGELIFSKK